MRAIHTGNGHAMILSDNGGLTGVQDCELPSTPAQEVHVAEDLARALRHNLNPKGTDDND